MLFIEFGGQALANLLRTAGWFRKIDLDARWVAATWSDGSPRSAEQFVILLHRGALAKVRVEKRRTLGHAGMLKYFVDMGCREIRPEATESQITMGDVVNGNAVRQCADGRDRFVRAGQRQACRSL